MVKQTKSRLRSRSRSRLRQPKRSRRQRSKKSRRTRRSRHSRSRRNTLRGGVSDFQKGMITRTGVGMLVSFPEKQKNRFLKQLKKTLKYLKRETLTTLENELEKENEQQNENVKTMDIVKKVLETLQTLNDINLKEKTDKSKNQLKDLKSSLTLLLYNSFPPARLWLYEPLKETFQKFEAKLVFYEILKQNIHIQRVALTNTTTYAAYEIKDLTPINVEFVKDRKISEDAFIYEYLKQQQGTHSASLGSQHS